MQYWDTSALVKLYISEPDSALFAAHAIGNAPLVCCELARWEVFRVLTRKEAEGFIANGTARIIFSQFLGDVNAGKVILTPIEQNLEFRFQQLVTRLHSVNPPLLVRTLDGIHIANADLHGATEFVATDINVRKCAGAIGLKLFP